LKYRLICHGLKPVANDKEDTGFSQMV